MTELITSHVLRESLHLETANIEIARFDIRPLSKKCGIFGEHYFLTVYLRKAGNTDDDDVSTETFFVKTLPQVESQRLFTLQMGANYKEEQLFGKFVPMMHQEGIYIFDDVCPKFYTSLANEYIIFEDLSRQNYKCLNQRISLSLPNVKLLIDKMARLHASAIALEEKLDGISLYDTNPREFTEMLYCNKPESLQLIDAMKKGAITQFALFDVSDKYQRLVSASIDRFVEFVKPSAAFRNTICHGDLWANNIMYKLDSDATTDATTDATDCKIVDYQSYRYCPPAQDLLSFIYLSTDRRFRHAHYDHVLRFYYDQLDAALAQFDVRIDGVLGSFGSFLDTCSDRQVEEFAIAQSVTHFQVVMMSAESMAWFLADPEYNRVSMFEDRSDFIREVAGRDAVYKNKLEESVMDFVEYCDRNKF